MLPECVGCHKRFCGLAFRACYDCIRKAVEKSNKASANVLRQKTHLTKAQGAMEAVSKALFREQDARRVVDYYMGRS